MLGVRARERRIKSRKVGKEDTSSMEVRLQDTQREHQNRDREAGRQFWTTAFTGNVMGRNAKMQA